MTKISTRLANADDCKDIFIWRNDATTRAMSLTQDLVAWDDHLKWFEVTLQKPDCYLIISSLPESGEKACVVRLDVADTRAIISINMAPAMRGRKLASLFLQESIRFVSAQNTSLSEIIAEIKPDNIASQKAFEKAGFEIFETENTILRFKLGL